MSIFEREPGAWAINYTLRKDDSKGRKWSQNKQATVITFTAERAIVLLLEREPDAHVFAINHKGSGDLIIDPKL